MLKIEIELNYAFLKGWSEEDGGKNAGMSDDQISEFQIESNNLSFWQIYQILDLKRDEVLAKINEFEMNFERLKNRHLFV